jgi:hypothetical protein
MTRAEHLAWAKERALRYLDAGAPPRILPGPPGNLLSWQHA